MSRFFRVLIAIALVVALSGATCNRKPDCPPLGVAVRPEPVIVERRVYVPVPPRLTEREPIAEGPIAMCFDVAAQRRAALERANAKLEQVEAIQAAGAKP